jgi:hypothetical protein
MALPPADATRSRNSLASSDLLVIAIVLLFKGFLRIKI